MERTASLPQLLANTHAQRGCGDVVKRGCLYVKRPPNNASVKLRIKTWQKRYLILRDAWNKNGVVRLEIYDRQSDVEGQVPLSTTTTGFSGSSSSEHFYSVDLSEVALVDTYCESSRFTHAFIVVRSSGCRRDATASTPLIFGAETQIEMRGWLVAIRLLSDKAKLRMASDNWVTGADRIAMTSLSQTGNGLDRSAGADPVLSKTGDRVQVRRTSTAEALEGVQGHCSRVGDTLARASLPSVRSAGRNCIPAPRRPSCPPRISHSVQLPAVKDDDDYISSIEVRSPANFQTAGRTGSDTVLCCRRRNYVAAVSAMTSSGGGSASSVGSDVVTDGCEDMIRRMTELRLEAECKFDQLCVRTATENSYLDILEETSSSSLTDLTSNLTPEVTLRRNASTSDEITGNSTKLSGCCKSPRKDSGFSESFDDGSGHEEPSSCPPRLPPRQTLRTGMESVCSSQLSRSPTPSPDDVVKDDELRVDDVPRSSPPPPPRQSLSSWGVHRQDLSQCNPSVHPRQIRQGGLVHRSDAACFSPRIPPRLTHCGGNLHSPDTPPSSPLMLPRNNLKGVPHRRTHIPLNCSTTHDGRINTTGSNVDKFDDSDIPPVSPSPSPPLRRQPHIGVDNTCDLELCSPPLPPKQSSLKRFPAAHSQSHVVASSPPTPPPRPRRNSDERPSILDRPVVVRPTVLSSSVETLTRTSYGEQVEGCRGGSRGSSPPTPPPRPLHTLMRTV